MKSNRGSSFRPDLEVLCQVEERGRWPLRSEDWAGRPGCERAGLGPIPRGFSSVVLGWGPQFCSFTSSLATLPLLLQ